MATIEGQHHLQHPNHSPVTQRNRVLVLNNHGEKLVGVFHETGSEELVIVCHGFRSSKDRIPMVNLAVAFEKEGISAFRFDFAGNGESEGSFQYGNYQREADDLFAVVQHFHKEKRLVTAVIGHSKGYFRPCKIYPDQVILYASRYDDVQTIVNIAGRFSLNRGIEGRLGKDFREKIDQNGFIDVKSKRGKFEYRVTKESLMDRLTTDTVLHAKQSIKVAGKEVPYDAEALFANIWSVRALTIHGTMDEMVPIDDAFEFDKHVPNHRLHIIEGADHEFTSYQDRLASVVLDFVKDGIPACSSPHRFINSRF